MGHIHISGIRLLQSLSEHVGHKAGVALGREEFAEISSSDERLAKLADLHDDAYLRLESVEYENFIEALLFRLGRLERPTNLLPTTTLHHKYRRNKKLHPIAMAVAEALVRWMNEEMKNLPDSKKALDPTAFLKKCFEKHGADGLKMALEALAALDAYVFKSAWSLPAERQWKDTIDLKGLFEREGLIGLYGKFFDQRYIDFLSRNFSEIDRIHWRKFEQLTAEYLERSGYKVELGPGRNDDGVDIRAWSDGSESDGPPSLIVQCKRQKDFVDKVTIKGLYADVLHERASSGMIVTTSRLSRGAEKTCTARNYPVSAKDRDGVRQWLTALRKPGAGIVMPR